MIETRELQPESGVIGSGTKSFGGKKERERERERFRV